ncbi:hypothetical protein GBA63_19690 [Rubrobacter tropicus]|uniref:Uncharacterized protein n=1 Tax=Rubrobacter tropicus TaxID=2653851 RepID=A0A6G8QDU4_9ACTN|nr:hypothetical protein [Rubrobacter tropicus]QIN84623.1 hypothetical protein GBA63_19690 [Rubrobacter tropicus]
MGDHVPPSSVGPGRGMGPGRTGGASSMGPDRMKRKLGGPSGKGPSMERGKGLGKDPSMMPKGHGVFGRTPSIEKDGDPFTRRSPNKKPGNNSFF